MRHGRRREIGAERLSFILQTLMQTSERTNKCGHKSLHVKTASAMHFEKGAQFKTSEPQCMWAKQDTRTPTKTGDLMGTTKRSTSKPKTGSVRVSLHSFHIQPSQTYRPKLLSDFVIISQAGLTYRHGDSTQEATQLYLVLHWSL